MYAYYWEGLWTVLHCRYLPLPAWFFSFWGDAKKPLPVGQVFQPYTEGPFSMMKMSPAEKVMGWAGWGWWHDQMVFHWQGGRCLATWPRLSGIFASKVTSNPLFRTEMCRLSWELGAVAKHRQAIRNSICQRLPWRRRQCKILYRLSRTFAATWLRTKVVVSKYFSFSPLFGEDSHFD